MGGNRLGRWLLYSICLAPAVLMLGYYLLEYIPGQREYFSNLRFRALAIIGDQLRAKMEALASSLDNAPKERREQYFANLVPELESVKCDKGASQQAKFQVVQNRVVFGFRSGCNAEAQISRIVAPFSRDDLFDDVILADEKGNVVYQYSSSSPRLVELKEWQKDDSDGKSSSLGGNGANADGQLKLRLDDSDWVLLLQPVRIAVSGATPTTITIGGLVRAERSAAEAHHVPPKYLIVVFAPLAILILSGPFFKIVLLTRTGRLTFLDMVRLTVAALVTAGLVTTAIVGWYEHQENGRRSEEQLRQFAVALNDKLKDDVKAIRDTLAGFDDELPAYHAKNGELDRKDLLASGDPVATKAQIPFDFAFWTNADGCQVVKWTTKQFMTTRVRQTNEEHFRNVVARKLWTIDGEPDKQFTIQTLISPTTSQLIVVMEMPSKNPKIKLQACNDRQPSPVVAAAIVAPLPSVMSPLVPPDIGFAIIDPTGRVLFHSASERNLHENLLEEIHSPAPLRAALAMRAEQSIATYYRGRPYRFYLRPVTGFGGAGSWTIATFGELEPAQAQTIVICCETVTLLLTLFLLIAVGFLILSLVSRVYLPTWRSQVDFFLSCVWPDPRRGVIKRLAWGLTAAVLISIAVVVIGASDAYHSAPWLLAFCFLAPAAVVVLTAWHVWNPARVCEDAPPTGGKQPECVVCLSLLLMLVAVIPTNGLFHIAYAFETRLNVMHWQREMLNSVEARRARVRAGIEGSLGVSAEARDFLRKRFLPSNGPNGGDKVANGWDNQGYTTKFATTVGAVSAGGTPILLSWWQRLITKIRAETDDEALETGLLADNDFGDPNTSAVPGCAWYETQGGRAVILRCDGAIDASAEVRTELPPVTLPVDPVWWILALAMLGAVYAWNCLAFKRMFNLDFGYIRLPLLTETPLSVSGHLLVLGLPLARKDEAVRQWLRYTAPRVNLWEEQFSANWVDATCARLDGELRAISGKAVAGAAAVGSKIHSLAPSAPKPWVHISNLDTKLNEPGDREVVATLLERLVRMNVGDARVQLIITSNVDPVFHFDSVLSVERKETYEHPLPETELQHWARLLHNFCKVQLPGPDAVRPAWANTASGEDLYEECRHHPELLRMGEEVAECAASRSGQSRETLAMIAERATALYKLFWASCTRSEKLLLIQLAQTGLVNPLSLDTLQVLVRKGLIRLEPRPRIMNETFRSFLETVEAVEKCREWENEAGESTWVIIRNIVLVLIVLGLGVLALTQHQSLERVTAVVTGVGTALAGGFRLARYFTGRGAVGAEASAGSE